MKNIFKKNQIIITALAIMIAIAGYLSFTNNDTLEDNDSIQTANPDIDGEDIFSEMDGLDVVADDGTDEADADTDATMEEEGTTVVADNAEDGEEAAVDDADETIPVDVDTEELADISDEDILQTAQTVSDNGELEVEDEGVPGEAVLVSTTLNAGFFSSQKLYREQNRSKMKAEYKEIIENPNLSEDSQQEALACMLELTANIEKENATELLLEAKGYDGAVVSILDGKADVVINAESITDQQLAIIEDVVKSKADIVAEYITIFPVIVEE